MQLLMVETASPARVREKAKEIIAAGICPASDLTILCVDNPVSIKELTTITGARLIPLRRDRRREIHAQLKEEDFDAVWSFWTGEKRYRRMKLEALRIPARSHRIDIGDGHDFRLSPGTYLWFLRTRWRYPLPSDHFLFVPRPPAPKEEAPRPRAGAPAKTVEPRRAVRDQHMGEEVLVIQSADPPAVLRGLGKLRDRPLFRDPRYTLFCRNHREIKEQFLGHPLIHRIVTHTEARGALAHLASLRRQRFDAVVVFFTGDPSYWKIKFLPFFLGARHKLIFNENGDCFFFSWSAWRAHISRRLADNLEYVPAPRGRLRVRSLAIVAVKLILFPLRFVWLLLVWLWLRTSGLRSSG